MYRKAVSEGFGAKTWIVGLGAGGVGGGVGVACGWWLVASGVFGGMLVGDGVDLRW